MKTNPAYFFELSDGSSGVWICHTQQSPKEFLESFFVGRQVIKLEKLAS